MIVGVIILLIGIYCLIGIFNPSFQLDFEIVWPLVLIAISIYYIIKEEKLEFTKLLMLFIGLWFLLENTNLITSPYDRAFWPLILVITGGYIIFGSLNHNPKTPKQKYSKNSKNYFGIFSEVEDKIKTKSFKGADVYCIFGGAELDLTELELKSDAVLNVYCIFGGATIRVADKYNIVYNSTAILGENENKATTSNDEDRNNLIINCISFCGGTEIK